MANQEEEAAAAAAVVSCQPPPGYRFCPTDQQLLGYYLIGKINGQPLHPLLAGHIMQADLYGPNNEPDKVYSRFNISDTDCLREEFYFFTYVKKKFCTGEGNHMLRSAGKGNWKCQHPKPVFDESSRQLMAHMTTLNFQINNQNLTPSWIMHEYTLLDSDKSDHWAICTLKRGNLGKDKNKNKNKNNKRPLLSITEHADVQHQPKRVRPITASTFEFGPSSQQYSLVNPQTLPSPPPLKNHYQTFQASVPPTQTTNTKSCNSGFVVQPTNNNCPPSTSLDQYIIPGVPGLSPLEISAQVCSLLSETPTSLPQPTQLSSSSVQLLAEPLEPCGTTSTVPEEDSFDDLFTELVYCLSSSSECTLQEAHNPAISDVSGQVSEPTTSPQPTQLPGSSIQVPSEPLDQCGTSALPQEDCFFSANEMLDIHESIKELCYGFWSSNSGHSFEEAHNSEMGLFNTQNPFIESYGGIALS